MDLTVFLRMARRPDDQRWIDWNIDGLGGWEKAAGVVPSAERATEHELPAAQNSGANRSSNHRIRDSSWQPGVSSRTTVSHAVELRAVPFSMFFFFFF